MCAASLTVRTSRSCFAAMTPDATIMKSSMVSKPVNHTRSTRRSGQAASRHPADRSHAGKHILLVDDDPAVRNSLKEVLVSEGYCVIPAGNGEEALDFAARLPVDLVLLDLNMPVKNGWDTFQQLTAEHPLIPIIITTARPNQLFTAIGAGAGALLEKPLDIPTLLRAWLNCWRSQPGNGWHGWLAWRPNSTTSPQRRAVNPAARPRSIRLFSQGRNRWNLSAAQSRSGPDSIR